MTRSIKRDFQHLSIITVIISMVLLSGFWIFYDYKILQEESERLRTQYMRQYENLLHDEVSHVVEYIEYKKSLTEQRLKKTIKERTYEAYAIVTNLLKENAALLDEPTLHKLIKDSLRTIRFNNGRGYYFAFNMKGIEELFPTAPHFEGQDLRKMQNSQGQFVIQDMLEIAKSGKEGFYSYTWSKPDKPDRSYPKIAYIKFVPGLDWVIGTGEYLDDVTRDIQKEVLERIEQIRFGKDSKEYIFAGSWEGMSLTFPAKGKNMLEVKDLNGVYLVRELIAKAKTGGGFVRYVMPAIGGIHSAPKLSYAAPLPDWKWYVGAGVYIDEIDTLIAANKSLFKAKVFNHLKFMALALLCLLCINFLVAYFISQKIWKQIDLFSQFFHRASTESLTIDSSQLTYSEFHEIGSLANNMIQERNAFLQELRLSRDQWVNTFNAIGDIILLLDAEGSIIQANKAALTMFNLEETALVGTHFSEFCCDDNPIYRSLEDLQPHSAEIESIRFNKVFFASSFPICTEEGQLHRIIHIAHDITERRKLEEQLARSQKMEAIGLLAGGVAHDLNNILSGIVSYPDIIIPRLPEGSQVRIQVEAMRKSGLQAAEIVADLLTLARGVAASKKVVDLNGLILDHLESPESEKLKAQYPLVTILTHFDTDLLHCYCSPVHIKKSLMNLIVNAVEAIDDKGEIHISTANSFFTPAEAKQLELADEKYALLKVADTGPGIPPEDLERIFEPFYTKKEMGKSGTGLGLAVVWNTVQDHNGAIAVESDSDGTIFTMSLPTTEEKMHMDDEEQDVVQLKGHGETILIVDDEEQQRDIAMHFSTTLGYEPTAVESGENALAYLEKKDVDLVILDMLLGAGITGRQTYEKIIRIHPNQKALIVSGYSTDSEVDKTQQLGAGGFIKKPYTLPQLGRAIQGVLKGKAIL